MTVSVKTLIPARAAPASQTTVYTAISRQAVIDKFTGTNVGDSAAHLSVNFVDSGPTGDDNLITKAKWIQPSETYTFPELVGHVLNAGGYISIVASSADTITVMASGREIT